MVCCQIADLDKASFAVLLVLYDLRLAALSKAVWNSYITLLRYTGCLNPLPLITLRQPEKQNPAASLQQDFSIQQALSHCFNFCRQTAFVASRFVFVEHAFISDAIQNFGAFTVNGLCRRFIARFNRFQHFFNRSAKSSTQTCVVCTIFQRLTSTFTCLCAISHVVTPKIKSKADW